ncbi:RNA-binding protein [Lentibacillus sediminis]|uniref:YlmH family RNA-binding protein n=1 Tax=Lentibacillus sediminis TaxID=1940529 RepID=UPI000C1BC0D1|nr:YlmH/Sll1252 family protein [Lentibacillus sediminis]
MDIYQHFRKEEQGFVDQALSWKEEVEWSYQSRLTDFLDPREQQIVEMLTGTRQDELKISLYGGDPHTERCRMIIVPWYEEISEDSFQLTLLEASFPAKFIRLEHRDAMGAFLSLGIKRSKLGDIVVGDGVVQIIAAAEIAPYIQTNLTSIKKAKTDFREKPLSSLLKKEMKWVETDKTVSSLRLDVILKEIYPISRKEATEAISKLQAKVNFRVVDDSKFELQEGDLISLRGKGRSKLVSINGRTKKDKWKITAAVLADN